MVTQTLRGIPSLLLIGSLWALTTWSTAWAQVDPLQPTSPIHEVRASGNRLDMTVHTSRILMLSPELTEANRILRVDVSNRDILVPNPLSPTQIHVSARKPGVTHVVLWDKNENPYTLDVVVYGDARELALVLQDTFPNAALEVKPLKEAVLITGYVDQPEDVAAIVQVAEQFYPKVLPYMRVGGVHQVLLHVKAMEVSRTKLRALGFDWSMVNGNDIFTSGVSGLIGSVTKGSITVDASGGIPIETVTFPSATAGGGATISFDVIDGGGAFFGVLEALRQDSLAKILSEPTLMTVSGRPAFFQVGGEVPVLVPQGLGTVGVEYKRYGTQVDFVPIVLGNGKIRLEVRPRVSDIDAGRSVISDGQAIYAFKNTEVDTGVELQAGQTLAIAGLVQTRTESIRRGIPWVSEVPYLGAAFRRVEEQQNEVETLIFVTPELVDPMDADEVPPCGPGTRTTSPNDWELFMRGYLEVPNCCLPGAAGTMGDGTMPEPVIAPDAPGPPPSPVPEASSARSFSRQSRSGPQNRSNATGQAQAPARLPGFMGPVGYDPSE
ncbi:MAG: type II and III secretion system protein family protein [Planctomycetota bacterium]|jgi:pilus assembly protein CpaC